MKPGFGNIEVVFRKGGASKPTFVSAEIGLIDAYTIDILFDIALNESKVPDAGDLIPTFSGGATQIYDRTITGEHLYVKTGVNDWYLPSRDELLEVATVLDSPYGAGVRTFSADYYSTSSEFAIDTFIAIDFGTDGYPSFNEDKQNNYMVCPIRSFTSQKVYALRDVGPAGGWIFYKDGNNYLECASSDVASSFAWSNISNVEIGTTGTAIGTGQANTTAIINQAGHLISTAKSCDDLIIGRAIQHSETGTIQYVPGTDKLQGVNGGLVVAFTEGVTNNVVAPLIDLDGNEYTTVIISSQEWIVQNLKTTKYADGSPIPVVENNFHDDWFLPSKDEFNKMDTELHQYNVGNFASDYYWTSSEYDATQAYQYNLVDSTPYFITKASTVRVRACRLFNAEVGDYALRAIGPAGGLIFYTDGEGLYYEAAPSDQSTSYAWSNVTDVLIGTTSTAIGTGQANTTAIINQLEGNHGPVTDLDGNEYTTTIINNHMWINENLKVTKYADNSAISKITDNSAWTSDTNGAYCAYNNDDNNISTNGLIYNGYALNKDVAYLKLNGVQESGWRIPLQIEINDNHISMEENGSFNNPPLGYRTAVDGTFSVEYQHWWLESSTSYIITWGWLLGSISSFIFAGVGQRKGHAIRLMRNRLIIHTDSAAKLCNDLEAGGWIDYTVGAMCWYEDNAVYYKETYGALYNWYAVNNIAGLAYLERNSVQEAGWRVPTDVDFSTLSTFLGGDAVAGGKLKEAGIIHWGDPNTGADNSSGFTGLPGGIRQNDGSYISLNYLNSIGTSVEDGASFKIRNLSFDNTNFDPGTRTKESGISIRLVRDV